MDETQIRALNAKLKELETENEDLKTKLEAANSRADAADGKLDVANKKIGDLEAQVQTRQDAVNSEALAREKARADSAEQKVRMFDDRFAKAVGARAGLLARAATIMGPAFRMDDMTDRQIRNEVVKRLDSSVDVGEAVPDGKVEGLFDALVEGHLKNARQLAEIGEHLDSTVRSEKKRVENDVDNKPTGRRDQWKAPLPSAVRFKNAKES